MSVGTIFKKFGHFCVQHSPTILTGLGVAGVISTAVFTVDSTKKATRLVDSENAKRDKPMTKKEVVKKTWKFYIPPAITGATSIACMIGATSISTKRNAVLASLYSASEVAATEYKNKVVEMIGEKKAEKVEEAIEEDYIKAHPPEKGSIIETGKGDMLFLDMMSGQYFHSSIEAVQRAINIANDRILHEDCITVNEFLDELGLKHIFVGDTLSFESRDGMIKSDIMDLAMDYHLRYHTSEWGEPCVVISYQATLRDRRGNVVKESW